jgi:hypothetical protein
LLDCDRRRRRAVRRGAIAILMPETADRTHADTENT